MKLTKKIFKGFTLIELLVVIAVLGVLAAAIIAAIDPVEKIRQANDSRMKGDLNNIAKAIEIYATQNSGLYPASQALLLANSDLKGWPVPPGDYSAIVFVKYPSNCNNTTIICTHILVYGTVKAKASLPYTRFFYNTKWGRVCGLKAGTPFNGNTPCDDL